MHEKTQSVLRRMTLVALLAVGAAAAWVSAGSAPAIATGGVSVVSVDGNGDAGDFPSIALDSAGNPVIAYIDRANGSLKVLRCGDPTCTAGNVITTPEASRAEYISMELDSAGRPVMSYIYVEAPAVPKLRVLRCGDATCSAGNSIATIATGSLVGEYPSLELDANDRPVVAFHNFSVNELHVLFCGNTTCTAGNSTVEIDSDAGVSPSLALDGAGNPVMSYFDLSTNDFKIARCGTPTCSGGNTTAIAGEVEAFGSPSSIQLDASSRPIASYTDAGGQLAILHCGNLACTAGNSTATPTGNNYNHKVSSLVLDAAGNPVVATDGGPVLHCDDPNCAGSEAGNFGAGQAGSPSLRLDSAGNPVIASYSGTLYFTHCNDPKCQGGGETVGLPDPARNVGADSSIALDAVGNPVISYYDGTSGDLKVVHCGNEDCTAGNTFAVPDSAGIVGQGTALALDSSGNPVVAYSDVTGGQIKLLHCGDVSCLSGNTIESITTDSAFHLSLRLDSAGIPVMAYLDADDHALKIVRCGDATCSSGNSFASFDTGFDPGIISEISNLLLDAADNPFIYYEGSSTPFLHCGNPSCSSGNVAFAAPVNTPVRIALDATGNLIAAHRASSWRLGLIHCNDPLCSGSFSDEIVDSERGRVVDLLLDSAGRPVIVFRPGDFHDGGGGYHPPANYTVLERCLDVDCTSVTRSEVGTIPVSSLLNPADMLVGSFQGGFADLFLLRCNTSDCIQDFDGDSCPDAAEQQLGIGSEKRGGRRDAKNPNDYFNPSNDGKNRVDDVLLVVQAYYMDDADGNPGLPPYELGYDPDTDRTLVGPNAWNLGAPNGLQRIDDILNSVKQYFHDCS